MSTVMRPEDSKHPTIQVVVPVLNRPDNVIPLLQSFADSNAHGAFLTFVVETEDDAELAAIAVARSKFLAGGPVRWGYCLVPPSVRSWAAKINHLYRRHWDWYEWLLLAADDVRFHKGWNTEPLLLMNNQKIGVVGTNDLGNPLTIEGTHSTHPFVRAAYVEQFGGIEEARGIVVPECYHHNYPDTELIAIAKKRGAYAHCKTAIIEHLHPVHNKAQIDDTYRLGQSRFNEDRRRFFARASVFEWPVMGHSHPVDPQPAVETRAPAKPAVHPIAKPLSQRAKK